MTSTGIHPGRAGTGTGAGLGSSSTEQLAFSRLLRPLVVFLVGTALAVAVVLPLGDRVLPPTPLASTVFTAAAITAVALVAWGALRWESVSAAAVGLDRERLVPGLVAVVAIWLGVNVIGYGLLVLLGGQPTLGLPANQRMGLPVGAPASEVVGTAVALWVFVGIGEEFAFRGYLQNKVLAHLGSGNPGRRVVGIAGTAVLFGLWHIPQYVAIRGAAGPALLALLLAATVYAFVLGVVYELTRNVVLVGLLHGTFDLNPVVVYGGSGEPAVDLALLVVPLALVVLWAYRRWAKAERPSDFRPQTTAATAA
jgi:membrane protease YdiL (CAAX protease family)